MEILIFNPWFPQVNKEALITLSHLDLASEGSARRRRTDPPGKEKKVWKWEEPVASGFFLQGSNLLAKSSEMQNEVILSWNTVSSSDMNPKIINSASSSNERAKNKHN